MTLDKLSFQAVQRLTLRRDFLRDFELKIEKKILKQLSSITL